MHFSKTYTQLLHDLPPDLQETAIQYRALKKLINQVVKELDGMGLKVDVLRRLLDEQSGEGGDGEEEMGKGKGKAKEEDETEDGKPRIVYEVNEESGVIEPRLRVSLGDGAHAEGLEKLFQSSIVEVPSSSSSDDLPSSNALTRPSKTLIIPLQSDAAFFTLLYTTLTTISTHLSTIQSSFLLTLHTLISIITSTALPSSRSSPSSFKPYSILSTHPRDLHAPSSNLHSDLYAWREIVGLFVEAEIFESVREKERGKERSIEEMEERIGVFVRGVKGKEEQMGKKGKEGVKLFLQLILVILNLKKFQMATTEASRKILKKHTKRTALPNNTLVLSPQTPMLALPKTLLQALSTSLLPILPSLDDFTCIICTTIAFKPIRLSCSHLFCVRCLVKMQKRGQGECPMCRASKAVEKADKGNVDWALLNFMQDWFPRESREKMRSAEREVVREQMEEMGLNPDAKCVVM